MKPFPEIKTNRLHLKEIKNTHLEDIFKIYKDEKVTKYYDLLPLTELSEAKKEIEFFRNRFKENTGIRWGISYLNQSEIIGTVGFNKIIDHHKGRIGYDLQSRHWGKGIMTEALEAILNYGFNSLELNRIEAEVMIGNVASEKLLTKLHFQKEGILSDWMYWNNRYYDISMYSLIKKGY